MQCTPTECLVKILSFVDVPTLKTSVPFVCAKWKYICKRYISITFGQDDIDDCESQDGPLLLHGANDAAVSVLTSRFFAVSNVNLSRCPNVTLAAFFNLIQPNTVTRASKQLTTSIAATCTSTSTLSEPCPTPTLTNRYPKNHVNTIRLHGDTANDAWLTRINQRCRLLCHLDLSFCSAITNTVFTSICFPYLESIDLNCCFNLSNVALVNIAMQCPRLRSVNLAHCPQVNDMAITTFVQLCRHLESLNLGGCNRVTDASLIAIARFCPLLTHLNLLGCDRVTDSGLSDVAHSCRRLMPESLLSCHKGIEYYTTLVTTRGDSLTQLDLSRCFTVTTNTAIDNMFSNGGGAHIQSLKLTGCRLVTDDGVHIIAQHCVSLTHLELSGCYNVTDLSMRAIASQTPCAMGLPLLTSLCLQSCTGVTDEGIWQLVRGCSNLSSINLSFCSRLTNETLVAIAQELPWLQSLTLCGCTLITDRGIFALARGSSSKELQVLDLSFCCCLTDVAVGAIAENLGSLVSLDISFCDKITDDGMIQLSHTAIGDTLIVLGLAHCRGLTDVGVVATVSTCHNLQSIILRGCANITDESVAAIGTWCQDLLELDLQGCEQLTDASFVAIAEDTGCKYLRSLCLERCKHITDDTLHRLAHVCSQLQELNLVLCPLITTEGITAVSNACADLHWLAV